MGPKLPESRGRPRPRPPSPEVAAGLRALESGDVAVAIESLERAIAADPRDVGALLAYGSALRIAGRLSDSEAAFRGAIVQAPGIAIAHNNLGNVLRDLGKTDAALASYRRAASLDADLFAAAANYAHTLASSEAAPLGERAAAYRRALAIARKEGRRGADVANLHNALANVQLRGGAPDDAIASYRRAVAEDPRFFEAQLNLGETLARRGRLEDAVEPLRIALALGPDDVRAFKRLTLVLRKLRRTDEATAVFRAWSDAHPDDAIARHMAAIGSDTAPDRCSDAYVRAEFDGLAAVFESTVARLDYRGPEAVARAIDELPASARSGAIVLDAGCGTGLSAAHLRPIASRLVGVDLSPKMLALAGERGLYDELHEAELTSFVERAPSTYDVIVAADVLIYFGRLDAVVGGMARALRAGGHLVASFEEALEDLATGHALGAGGRYVHRASYVRDVVEAAGLGVVSLRDDVLRHELGDPVASLVLVALKSA